MANLSAARKRLAKAQERLDALRSEHAFNLEIVTLEEGQPEPTCELCDVEAPWHSHVVITSLPEEPAPTPAVLALPAPQAAPAAPAMPEPQPEPQRASEPVCGPLMGNPEPEPLPSLSELVSRDVQIAWAMPLGVGMAIKPAAEQTVDLFRVRLPGVDDPPEELCPVAGCSHPPHAHESGTTRNRCLAWSCRCEGQPTYTAPTEEQANA